MATLTITNIRAVRRNVTIASSLDVIQSTRSRSSPTAMDRQPDPRIHTPRTIYLPGDATGTQRVGASASASDQSTSELKPRNCYNWSRERGAAANGTHFDLQEGRDHLPAQRGAGQIADRGKLQVQRGAGQTEGHHNIEHASV